jgi:imidazolonepropionase-like amidohydrolase
MLPLLIAAAMQAATPSDSVVYPVLNHERRAGSMVVTHTGDTTTVRYVFTDRNRGSRQFVRYVNRNGQMISTEMRPVLADGSLGDATLRVTVIGDSLQRWVSGRTSGEALKPGVYYGVTVTPYDEAQMAKYLLARPRHMSLVPGNDSVRATVMREVAVQSARGQQHVKLVRLDRGTAMSPQLIWLDARNELFATEVGWFQTIKPGAEPALPTLRKIEMAVRDSAAESLNRKLVRPTSAAIAITHGDLFDSETGAVRPNTTVIVRGDRIVAVGPAESTGVPRDATVIDATGKTIMPGMWDMHGHLQLTSQSSGGLLQLMYGITTVRDLGSDPDVAVSIRDRAAAGRIASPREILSAFIDGPQAWMAPTPSSNLVSTEDQARRIIAHYDSLGYKQVKVYNLIHPDLIPTIAAEAHRRGMRLSGHIPRGLSVPAAVMVGFDEVNHAAFLFSTFYQDSLYVPTMRAYSLVASIVAPNVDVDGPAMTNLIDVLRQHHTVIDGTFAVWIQSAGTGIAQQVGAGVPANVAKADANYMRLIKRLYDADITLVPGTDNFGSTTFDTELELYEKAGIPASKVLQIATIIPARVMKDDKDYGSVTVGKVADLIVIDGKPAERLSDVRKVEQVVRGGRLYDAASLRAATGYRGR